MICNFVIDLFCIKQGVLQITKGNRLYETRLVGNGEVVLVISYVTIKTAGVFECCATNSEGTVSSESNFIVHCRLTQCFVHFCFTTYRNTVDLTT